MTPQIRCMRALGRHALRIHAVCERWQPSQRLHTVVVRQSALQTWRLARSVRVWLFKQDDRRYYPTPWFGSGVAWLSIVAFAMRASDRSRLEWLNRQMASLNHAIAEVHAVTGTPGLIEELARHEPLLFEISAVLAQLSEGSVTDLAGTMTARLRLVGSDVNMRPAA